MVIQENIDTVEDDVATVEADLATVEDRVQDVENRVTNIEERDVTVGFSATLSSNTDMELDETLIFDNVLTNYGNAYNSSTGSFIAPMHGLYEFSLFYMKTTSSDQINLFLLQNGSSRCGGVANDSGGFETSSCSAFLELNVGDIVAVHCGNAGPVTIYGNKQYSGFNGHLVYLL